VGSRSDLCVERRKLARQRLDAIELRSPPPTLSAPLSLGPRNESLSLSGSAFYDIIDSKDHLRCLCCTHQDLWTDSVRGGGGGDRGRVEEGGK
jgi:hypothetical protein